MPRGIYTRKNKILIPKETDQVIEKVVELIKDSYKVVLSANADFYEARGNTIYEALTSLQLDYTQIKTKGTITVFHGTKKYEHFYYLQQLRKMLANKTLRAGFAKNLGELLKIKG